MKNFSAKTADFDSISISGEAPVVQSDIGTAPNQIPLNQDLGSLAYMDSSGAEFDLSQISTEITGTAVDVFVYDTSRDSDGGAWRTRTQNTSWYNEKLNTATRGSRREFPAVAVIVAEADKVTIYDGDDPDLSMWMVFEQGGSTAATANLIGPTQAASTSVFMLNGVILVTENAWGAGLISANFISEGLIHYWQASKEYNGNISQRNDSVGYSNGDNEVIVDGSGNDVAMTVLPNAPIDDNTGLPIPTIAVATDGGVSIIKHDGSVVDITVNNASYSYARRVNFLSDNSIGMGIGTVNGIAQESYYIFNTIPSSDNVITVDDITGTVQNVDEFYAIQKVNSIVDLQLLGLDNNRALSSSTGNSFGANKGLSIVNRNVGAPDKGMVAYTTSTYNTGWMPGDIKLATLSDSVEGEAEILNNAEDWAGSDTNTEPTGWLEETADSTTFSVSSGELTMLQTGVANSKIYQAFNVTQGQLYRFEIRFKANSGTARYQVADNPNASGGAIVPSRNYTGSTYIVESVEFTAASTTQYSIAISCYGGGASATFDYVRLIEVETVGVDESTELVENGHFTTDTTGWSTIRTDLSIESEKLKITINDGASDNGSAYQELNLIGGKKYTVSGYIENGNAVNVDVLVTNGVNYITDSIAITSGSLDFTFDFIADYNLNRLVVRVEESAVGQYAYADGISVKQTGELITNGTFDNGTTGWTETSNPTLTVTNGKLNLKCLSGDNQAGIHQNFLADDPNRKYTLSFDIDSFAGDTAANLVVGVDNYWNNSSLGTTQLFSGKENGSYSFTFNGRSGGMSILFRIFDTTGSCSEDTSINIDNISVRLAEDDRSVNDNGLQIFGEIKKTPVAHGSDLVAYSGFSADNYLMQPYNPDLDFGTGDFCMMAWIKDFEINGDYQRIFSRGVDGSTGVEWDLYFHVSSPNLRLRYYVDGVNMGDTYLALGLGGDMHANTWNQIILLRKDGVVKAYINGSSTGYVGELLPIDLTNTNAHLCIGNRFAPSDSSSFNGSMALTRISTTVPTDAQIAKIYRDEKVLFQDGAQVTLYGASDAVTALAYDDSDDLLHVGTASGRSVFNGLKRVDNTTTAVSTAISATEGLVIEQ